MRLYTLHEGVFIDADITGEPTLYNIRNTGGERGAGTQAVIDFLNKVVESGKDYFFATHLTGPGQRMIDRMVESGLIALAQKGLAYDKYSILQK